MRKLLASAGILASIAIPALANNGGPVSIVWIDPTLNSEIVWFSNNDACEMDFVSNNQGNWIVPAGIPMAAAALIWRENGESSLYYSNSGGPGSLDGYLYCVAISR